jgi:hypothetical protein
MQSDPTGGDETLKDRKRLLSYGHRLFCRNEFGTLRHAWAAKKLYRLYSTDYRRFLARPENVAKQEKTKLKANQHIAIVTADLSRFYDRVRPDLLHKRILEFQENREEQSFFDFAGQLFDWNGDTGDTKRAAEYADGAEPKLVGFERIALPQGLVAAGFFANLALHRFDRSLSRLMGKPITMAPGVTLLDACRYVDDMRLVLRVPKAVICDDLEDKITNWSSTLVRTTAPGLQVERNKTHIIIEGAISVPFPKPMRKRTCHNTAVLCRVGNWAATVPSTAVPPSALIGYRFPLGRRAYSSVSFAGLAVEHVRKPNEQPSSGFLTLAPGLKYSNRCVARRQAFYFLIKKHDCREGHQRDGNVRCGLALCRRWCRICRTSRPQEQVICSSTVQSFDKNTGDICASCFRACGRCWMPA